MEHLLTVLEVVMAYHLRGQLAVGVLLIDLSMGLVALKKSLIMYQVKIIIIEYFNWYSSRDLCS